MNKTVFTLLLVCSLPCWANQSKSPVPATEKAKYVYLEFYPNSSKPLTIQAIKCDPKVNDLKVQKFETESKVVNGTVNVMNLYVRAGDCKESPLSSVWQETIPTPKNSKHTHVYVTILSDNAMVL